MSDIPTATISRLVIYLRLLEHLEEQCVENVSSQDLAERAGVTAFQVRKDLAYFGRFGHRGKGYSVPVLHRQLLRVLGLNRPWKVVLVGMGRLGQAIAHYAGADDYHFQYVGLFDVNPKIIGQQIRGQQIRPMSELKSVVQEQFLQNENVDMGFLAVPPEQAQEAAEMLVDAGIRGILNFAPVVLKAQHEHHTNTPHTSKDNTQESPWDQVFIENVDFLSGMKRLAFYLSENIKSTNGNGTDNANDISDTQNNTN